MVRSPKHFRKGSPMKTYALALALIAASFVAASSPAKAQYTPAHYMIDAGSKIAGPFDSYYACSKMMDILKNETRDNLICAQ